MWYSQITTTSEGLILFGKQSIKNYHAIFIDDVYTRGHSPLEYINVFTQTAYFNPIKDLTDYSENLSDKYSDNLEDKMALSKAYPINLAQTSQLPYKNNFTIFSFNKIEQIMLLISGIFIIFGCFYVLFSKKFREEKLFKIILFVSLFSLILISFLPFLSTSYNYQRLYQQALIPLAICSILGFSVITKKINLNIIFITFALFLMIYLLLFIRVEYEFIGGNNIQLRFENVGKDYDLNYVTFNEISSANWLFTHKYQKIPIVLDVFAKFKIYQASEFILDTSIKSDVLPISIEKKDYVYASRSNILQGITFKYYGSGLLIYNFPIKFLNDNKNKIYNNVNSAIFK